MKLKHSLTIGLFTVGLSAAVAQEAKVNVPGATGQPAAGAATAAKTNYTEAQLVEEFGWFIGKRVGLTELEFTKAEIEALLKGISKAASGHDSPYELEKIGPSMDEFMQKKQGAYMSKLKEKSTAATSEYFAKLKDNKNVVELPSGLRYEIVKPGDGPFPKASDTVKVHYTGALIDGSVFDSSVQRGEPAEFPLEGVIPGWTEGIQKMSKGGKIKLYVPSQLGYGDEGRPGIPPASTLVFDVELLEIKAGSGPASPGLPPGHPPTGKQ